MVFYLLKHKDMARKYNHCFKRICHNQKDERFQLFNSPILEQKKN